jgi:hypothetical protein
VDRVVASVEAIERMTMEMSDLVRIFGEVQYTGRVVYDLFRKGSSSNQHSRSKVPILNQKSEFLPHAAFHQAGWLVFVGHET